MGALSLQEWTRPLTQSSDLNVCVWVCVTETETERCVSTTCQGSSCELIYLGPNKHLKNISGIPWRSSG